MKGTLTYTLDLQTMANGVVIDHETEVEIEYDGLEVVSVTDTDPDNPNPDMYISVRDSDWSRIESAIIDAHSAAADRMRD